ncbi:filamentous hemagglutinin N-terminal domain-containing protein [Beggiatoa leptomitoformis]|uniref:Filamentous hemagglutinin N-terminal domain-containing protein n=1 Tax=Beggiatoa leptomitoformis TaxID=288004 RepID=A0A2N9YGA9_9GAMM|nr:filamentous hemagglutinin N-terminal domain-containing protein [Beggiatoa leptomitoformis]ALG68265.1 filamentous hemagglutinin N-terminal domain-containing protein [Beggiatoa leptomitoformis]AUI69425.1 filamentous hemagglutinin N-terminal domain-containing protein [Beggiatoa leptomitoformis]
MTIHYFFNGLSFSLFLLLKTVVHAEVILDGSLGRNDTLTGTNIEISADMGQQVGHNLFHSFDTFNLNKEESVHFTGNASIENVITRITGGERSSIDGTIYNNIPNANLFLLNDSGFIFGPNAVLNTTGDVVISTASELYLGENGVFYSSLQYDSILSSANPSAFGFLNTRQPAVIDLQNSLLDTADGKTLYLSAHAINLNATQLSAPSGTLILQSVAFNNQLIPTADELIAAGTIRLLNNSTLDVGTEGGGSIYIRSEQFELTDSDIIANVSKQDGGVVSIETNTLTMTNANIDSRTLDTAQGGNVNIQVKQQATLSNSNIFTTSRSTNAQAGDAGNISLWADCLDMSNSTISTTTYGAGQGGDITLTIAKNFNLTSVAGLLSPTSSIQARSEQADGLAGDAGRVIVNARNLTLTGRNTRIDNSTLGTGQGGNITLNVTDRLQLDSDTSILADSRGTGNAGSININTNQLSLQNSTISSKAEQANGGNIILNVRQTVTMNTSEISATVSGGTGNGGNLAISNPHLFYLTDSKIIANAKAGNGGSILIITDLPLESLGSEITASSEAGTNGRVQIDIPTVTITTLPVTFLDAVDLIQQRCAARSDDQVSSFVLVGRGGLPNSPEDLQSYLPVLLQSPKY